ncbi:unnamed protein product [Mytilus edulis]|uniref:OLD protein-like TOPRIM domain-containing protein n=1 Tax=Mytilus edulis TaxID=6550 RepID=A0A8S3RW10_MYTED|nr:unnamed protein product [Mytilus edulis]
MKVNSLGVALRTATEVRNKWRNTTRVAKAVYTTHRNQPTINATLPEEDASQDLYESAASLIRDSPPPSSPPSPSLLSGYDPILTQTVVPHIPEQTDRTDKQNMSFVESKKDQKDHDYYKVLCTPKNGNSYDCYRILFVEGFTDKIILESMFDVLFNDEDLKYVHRGKEAVVLDEEFRQYISSIQIVELEGKDNGPKKMKFCDELKRDYFVVEDFDVVRVSNSPLKDSHWRFR